MPQVGGESFPYTKKGRGAAQQRQRILKERYGKNWRAKFYGDIPGYQHGVVKTVNKLRERLQEGRHPKASKKYDRLYQPAQDVLAKRQRFDERQGIKAGKAQVETQGGLRLTGRTQTAVVRQRKRRKLRPVRE